MKIEVRDFDIKQIAESGQCFRWNKLDEMKYKGIIENNVCIVSQSGNTVEVEGIDRETFNYYFDIQRDYSKIKEGYLSDPVLKEAVTFGEGIRILNQDKFETLISFIISANNNIPRIKKSIEKISRRYGEKFDDENYAFPTVEELLKADEESLKDCGVGFRAKYIVNTCKMIFEGENLDEIAELPVEECKKRLMKFMGVGPKVADCTMLFSMRKVSAFPVDVWIKRIIESLYLKRESSIKEIEIFAKVNFGEFAGIAQQYLFFFARETKLTA